MASLAIVETVKIDRFGRILIPKNVRDRLGVAAGQEFELAVVGRALILEPRPEQVTVKLVGRTPVFEGTLPPGDVDWVAEARRERGRDILEGENR